MKKIVTSFLFVVLVVLFSQPVVAGNKNNSGKSPALVSLKGVVLDKNTHERLAGVSVYIESLDQKVYTDANGFFEIPAMMQGTYTFGIQCISYKDKKVQVDTEEIKKGKLNIILEPVNP